jgi:hypothetical protein
VALDSAGSPVLTGVAPVASFPTTPGSYDVSFNGAWDVFVSKFSSDGSTLEWSTFLGGSGQEKGQGISLDSAGNAVVVGLTLSSDFPTTAGAYDRSYNGGDTFVAKLSAGGDALMWSTFLGGSGSEDNRTIALDASENIVVTGSTYSTDFPTTAGAHDGSHNGGSDVFVAKLSSTGSSLLLGSYFGGSAADYPWSVRVDPSGDLVLAGWTGSSDLPTTAGAYDRTYNGGDRDAFCAKFSGADASLIWSTFLGGSNWDWSYGMDLDGSGNPVLSGGTWSSDFPTTAGAYDESSPGYDVWVSKFSASGSVLLWSTYLGGSGNEEAYDLAVDSSGNAIVTGSTGSDDFPTTANGYDESFNGGMDIFVTQVSVDGSDLLWSSYVGGYHEDRGWRLALDALGDPVVAGHTYSSDFPATEGAYDETSNGNYDAHVLKLNVQQLAGADGVGPRARGILVGAPNPVSDTMHISYTLLRDAAVDLRVLDLTGRVAAVLRHGRSPVGRHSIVWDGCDHSGEPVPSGVYFARLQTDRTIRHYKFLVVR